MENIFLLLSEKDRKEAEELYQVVMEKHLLQDRNIKEISYGILYIIWRQKGEPRTRAEVAALSGIGEKRICRTVRILAKKLGKKLRELSPEDFVPRWCKKLELSSKVITNGLKLAKMAKESEIINGRRPSSIATASIYIAAIISAEHRTQKEVSDVTGVTDVTIRKRYKEMKEKLDFDILF